MEKKENYFDCNDPIWKRTHEALNAAESLKELVLLLDRIKNDYLPELPETKKAAQSAVKELCAVLNEYADKD